MTNDLKGEERILPRSLTGPTDVRRITAPAPPPPVVDTRFAGRLEFKGGFPTGRPSAVSTISSISARLPSVPAPHDGRRDLGLSAAFTRDLDLGPTDLLMLHADANGLALTGNSETVYGVAVIDTKPGPVVLDVPPRVLGFLNDQWMRPMGDMGIAGPDHGQGGRYLLVPPGYEGDLPTDGFVATMRLRTYRQWLVLRAFMGPGGDPAPAMETLRGTRIAPLSDAGHAAPTRHLDGTGLSFDTIHPTDIRYFEDLATMVEYEPADAISLDEAAELLQIGIEKGKPFAPDARMRAILDEAAQVGSFMAFALTNAPRRDPRRWPDRQWFDMIHGYPTFVDQQGRPLIDDMVSMAWFATGRASAMAGLKPGVGSAYTWAYRDSRGTGSTRHAPTGSTCPGPSPPRTSGRSWSTTSGPARCSRTASRTRASAPTRPVCRSTTMAG